MNEERTKHGLRIDTSKLEEMAAFYEGLLGVPMTRIGRWWRVRYLAKVGKLELKLHRESAKRLKRMGWRALRIGVEDVSKAASALSRRGGVIIEDPHDSTLGRRASVTDPKGNEIQLVEAAEFWGSSVPFVHRSKTSAPRNEVRSRPIGKPSKPQRYQGSGVWEHILSESN